MLIVQIGFLILAYERGYGFWFTLLILFLLDVLVWVLNERKKDD